MKTGTTIKLDGPFFTHDPGKTFRANAREMLRAVGEEGRVDVLAQLLAGQSHRRPMHGITPNRVAEHVTLRTDKVTGGPLAMSVVVQVRNLGFTPRQGVTLMAAGAQVERETHAFRRTASRLRQARAVNEAELLKGLQ